MTTPLRATSVSAGSRFLLHSNSCVPSSFIQHLCPVPFPPVSFIVFHVSSVEAEVSLYILN